MNAQTDSSETVMPKLMLFVTDNAPRSRRARRNLAAALARQGMESVEPMEIDLLEHPEQTVAYSVFATPALLRYTDSGEIRVLYGDLSDERKLLDLLADV